MTTEERVLERAENTSSNLDGFYIISIHDDGVFLIVHPPQGNGKQVLEQSVVEELRSKNIEKFDMPKIVKTIKEAAAVEVKVAEPPEPEAEPEVQITISRDKLEASMQIVIPRNSKPLTMDAVAKEIENSAIAFGIDNAAVKRAFERPGLQVVFVRGQKPVDGKNAHIKYHIDLENKGRPVEQEDGRVDFKDLNTFTIVREGDLLAEKVSLTLGESGIDIYGNTIQAKPGKDILMPIGKNVKVEENRIVAGISGQLVIANGKISVIPVIEVKEDVDLSTGNIEFVGNVVIHGSVQAGFTVKAEGNVEISGNVSGGIVEGKNVLVRMGIQGMHRGYIKASENIAAKFIENATIYAGMDVVVADVVLHSKINAGRKVVVEGHRGLIAGGAVVAGEEIRAKVAGTHMATNTELAVGVNPQLREEYRHIRKEIKKVQLNLDQAVKALNILKSMSQAALSPEKRAMLLKLTKAQFHLVGQTESMRNRLTQIELTLEEMRYGRIRIADSVFPGVKVMVGTLVKPIREQTKYVSFFADDGEIKMGSFK